MGGFSTPSGGGGGGGGVPSNTVVNEQTYGQGSTPGIVGSFSRGDHTHGTPVAVLPSGSVISETNYGQLTSIGISAAFSRGDHSHGTPTVPSLNQLSDVTIAAPAVDEMLKFNGVDWVNGPMAVTGAGAGVMFFLDSTKIIPAGVGPQTKSLETLLKAPSVAAEVDEAQTVNNNTALIDQYMYNTALGVTSIDGGEWEFDTYTYVDDATNITQVIASAGRVFVGAGTIEITGAGVVRTATVTGGTPFVPADFNADITQTASIITPNAVLVVTGYTSTSVVTVTCLATYTNEAGVAYSVDRYMFQVTTGDINALAVSLFSTLTVQPAVVTNLTDKLMIKYFAKTDNVGDIVAHLVHNGTTNYTHIHTPLATKHNDLAGLQGGVANEYYHLTQAEYTGTGSGNFVRLNNATLTGTTAMTNATATTVNKVTITAPATSAVLTIADGKTLSVPLDATVSGTNTGDQTLPLASGTVSDETVYGIVANAGAAATFSRGDHTHGSPAAPTFVLLSDANRCTKGGTDALRDNIAGTDNSAFGYNALLLDTASFNTAFGSLALDANTTGVNNTAFGYQAGSAIATTNDCTFVGYNAGLVNTAANNTFIGSLCGDSNTSGTRNTAVGKEAGHRISTSNDSVFIGYQAGKSATGTDCVYIGSLVSSDAINSAINNTFVGSHAGFGHGPGANNTFIGAYAGRDYNNSAQANSTFVGYSAGYSNTANDNTFIGASCGDVNTSGTRNVAVGKDAMGANTTSSDITCVGYQAGLLSTGASNTFVGSSCGDANTTGNFNTAVGHNALGANNIGASNTAIGALNCCSSITSGNNNTAIGQGALASVTTQNYNIAIGTSAGFSNTADDNIFIGSNCGDANSSGTRNVAVGREALGANTTSSDITCIGWNAGLLSTGASNTFVGSSSADANTTGTNNTALGFNSLGASQTNSDCTTIGYQAGLLSTANNNTLVGSSAGDAITTGANNTALGKDAMGANSTSADSTALGYQAGLTNTGANNVFVGSGADGSAAARANAIGIGKGVSVVADSTWVIGTIGIKQAIVEGANAAMGTATLIGGTIAVANTLVTANSRIFITSQDPNGGTQGGVFISARTVGTDFTITSTDAGDTSIVAWEIKEPN